MVTDVTTLKVDDQIVIVAKGYDYALSTDQKSNNRGQVAIIKGNNIITFGSDVQILTLKEGTISGTFAFYTGSGYLCAASSDNNYLRTETTLSGDSSWAITIADGTASIIAQGTNSHHTMQYNQSSSLFACYASASQKALAIYKRSEVAACNEHTGGDPNCVNPGYCTNCGVEYIPALGHVDENTDHTCDRECGEFLGTHENNGNGVCDYCGGKFSAELTEKTASLNIYGTKGSLSSKVITWSTTGLTFKNAQASSTSAIRTTDNDHYRVYASSEVTISGSNIKKVVITCTSSSYATVMQTSIKNAGYTATVSGSDVTIDLSNSSNQVDTITFTASAQTRLNKIEVTYLG